jgi:asparagine synthase (glutamine-hydrolysing)
LLSETLASNLHSADCNGMAHSIETRFPYLDYRLVDWAVRLPNHALVHDGWMKYILRCATKDIVPDQIRWRVDKVGFAAPQDEWLRGSIKKWAEERLFEGPVTKQPGYNRQLIEQDWNDHQSGKEDMSWRLWRYISLNEWLTLFDNGVWQNGLAPRLTQRGLAIGE